MEELTFIQQAVIENRCRNAKWNYRQFQRDIRGENIYLEYCLYCNCLGRVDLKKSANYFGKWLYDNKIELTEYQRRYIANTFFGYNFVWDNETQSWRNKI